MNLYSQHPYWLMKSGIVSSYNSLDHDIVVDVAIMGSGISGALAAYQLRNSGLSLAVVDRRHAGMGSTAASTSFLQYEIDTPLRMLIEKIGTEKAIRSYQMCKEAIYEIGEICTSFKSDLDFRFKPSMQYASFKKDIEKLHEEYTLRKKAGFKVEWLNTAEIENKFGMYAHGGILSADGGEIDAYLFTHFLLKAVKKSGHDIFDNTNIKNIIHKKGKIILESDTGVHITAKNLIIACGYESMKYIPQRIAKVYSTYALVSEPLAENELWHQNSLVWETATPYMYFRTIGDGRIVIGGKDDEFHRANTTEATVRKKARLLVDAFHKRMKHIQIKPDYYWSGAFAVTKDGLPYIGTIPEHPNTYFALGYGGNGITFSVIAANIIHDFICNKKNSDAAIFGFNR